MEVSGSFEHEHEEGTTSKLVARLVPYGMVLDPDGKVDVFSFSNGKGHVHHVGTVTPDDCDDYIVCNLIDKVPGWKGGTTNSYVLERNLQHFSWLPGEKESEGFFNRFFGGGAKEAPVAANWRNPRSAATKCIFFSWAPEHTVDFEFLETIAKRFKNTGVVIVLHLDGFVDLSDEELNAQLLRPELLQWLRS